MNALVKLQEWYSAQCNGDWEHSFGVKIGTLDNPGWLVEVELTETELFKIPFNQIERGNCEEDQDWVSCKSDGSKFTGACGAKNLEEVLNTFFAWAEPHSRAAV